MIEIRSMTDADWGEAIALWEATEGVGLSAADERAAIASYLERNPDTSFVARDRDALVGAVLGGHDGRRGFIHHLAVDPRARRQGLGRALIEHCLEALRTAGIDKAHLFVFHANEAGIAFWADTGWTERVELKLFSRGTRDG